MVLRINTYPVENVEVVDGDTFMGYIIVDPFCVRLEYYVRIAGIDTPSVRTPEGLRLKYVLDTLLRQGEVTVRPIKLDKYAGRVVADVFVGDTNVPSYMLQQEGVRPYSGHGPKPYKE